MPETHGPDGPDRFGVPPADDCSLVAAEDPGTVAGSQEREVRAGYPAQQFAQV